MADNKEKMRMDEIYTGKLGFWGSILIMLVLINLILLARAFWPVPIVTTNYLTQPKKTLRTADGQVFPSGWVKNLAIPSSRVALSFFTDIAVGTSNPRNIQKVEAVFQQPAKYVGQRVTVRGTVAEVLSTRSFILERDVLVVNVSKFVPVFQALRGQTAAVEGVVTALDSLALADLPGMPPADVLDRFRGKDILLVDRAKYGSQL